MQMLEPLIEEPLDYEDERLLANITRASSPDTSSGASDSAGRGAALVKRPWTAEEDELLIAAVHKYGACRWSMIATQLSTGRVGKQCRERWNNHLCPEVKKSEWSEEEDRSIMQGVAVLGTRWCEIVKAPALSGRTDNAIKNRFYSLQRRMKARLTGGHRAGRRAQGPAGSEDNVDPPCQTDRIMAIATELAFATDECERDRLIEQLTLTLHEHAPDGPNSSDELDSIGPLESPDAMSALAALSKEFNPLGEVDDHAKPSRASSTFGSYHDDLHDDLVADPPTPLPMPMPLTGAAAVAALVPSVSAVADLLQLPLSPRRDEPTEAPAPPTERPLSALKHLSPPRASEGGCAQGAEADDASTASTISPDGAGGAGLASDDEAWKVPSAAPLAPSRPPKRHASLAPDDKTLQDLTLHERNTPNGGHGAARDDSPLSFCGSGATRGAVRPRPHHLADTQSAASPTSNGLTPSNGSANGCVTNEGVSGAVNISASLLGGRHAYKAFLAPLRVPAEQLAEVDSPKRMRTPTGAHTPGSAPKSRGGSGLRVCAMVANGTSAAVTAFPASANNNASPAYVRGPASGTGEPAVARPAGAAAAVAHGAFSPTSPMSELLNLSIFTDLFDEQNGALRLAAEAKPLAHTESIDSTATATTAGPGSAAKVEDVRMEEVPLESETATPKLVSPETALTTTATVKANAVGFGNAQARDAPKAKAVTTRRSARSCLAPEVPNGLPTAGTIA